MFRALQRAVCMQYCNSDVDDTRIARVARLNEVSVKAVHLSEECNLRCSQLHCNNVRCFGCYNDKLLNIIALKNEVGLIFNPLNAELNPICHFLALLGAHHILYVSRIRVN